MLYICIHTELEVHDVVQINIQSHEDAVAISLISVLNMIPWLETGKFEKQDDVIAVKHGMPV